MENGGREEVGLMKEKNRTTKKDFKMNIEGKPNIDINFRLPKLSDKMLSLLTDLIQYYTISFIGGAIGEQYYFRVYPNQHTYVSFKLRSIQLLPLPYSTDSYGSQMAWSMEQNAPILNSLLQLGQFLIAGPYGEDGAVLYH